MTFVKIQKLYFCKSDIYLYHLHCNVLQRYLNMTIGNANVALPNENDLSLLIGHTCHASIDFRYGKS